MYTYKRCWKWCARASIHAWTRLILFANTFCRSACEMFLMYADIAVFNPLSVRGRSRYTAATFRTPCTIRRMSCSYWIPRDTNTHSQYVIISVFPCQQWLRESASMLRYKNTACRVTENIRYVVLSSFAVCVTGNSAHFLKSAGLTLPSNLQK